MATITATKGSSVTNWAYTITLASTDSSASDPMTWPDIKAVVDASTDDDISNAFVIDEETRLAKINSENGGTRGIIVIFDGYMDTTSWNMAFYRGGTNASNPGSVFQVASGGTLQTDRQGRGLTTNVFMGITGYYNYAQWEPFADDAVVLGNMTWYGVPPSNSSGTLGRIRLNADSASDANITSVWAGGGDSIQGDDDASPDGFVVLDNIESGSNLGISLYGQYMRVEDENTLLPDITASNQWEGATLRNYFNLFFEFDGGTTDTSDKTVKSEITGIGTSAINGFLWRGQSAGGACTFHWYTQILNWSHLGARMENSQNFMHLYNVRQFDVEVTEPDGTAICGIDMKIGRPQPTAASLTTTITNTDDIACIREGGLQLCEDKLWVTGSTNNAGLWQPNESGFKQTGILVSQMKATGDTGRYRIGLINFQGTDYTNDDYDRAFTSGTGPTRRSRTRSSIQATEFPVYGYMFGCEHIYEETINITLDVEEKTVEQLNLTLRPDYNLKDSWTSSSCIPTNVSDSQDLYGKIYHSVGQTLCSSSNPLHMPNQDNGGSFVDSDGYMDMDGCCLYIDTSVTDEVCNSSTAWYVQSSGEVTKTGTINGITNACMFDPNQETIKMDVIDSCICNSKLSSTAFTSDYFADGVDLSCSCFVFVGSSDSYILLNDVCAPDTDFCIVDSGTGDPTIIISGSTDEDEISAGSIPIKKIIKVSVNLPSGDTYDSANTEVKFYNTNTYSFTDDSISSDNISLDTTDTNKPVWSVLVDPDDTLYAVFNNHKYRVVAGNGDSDFELTATEEPTAYHTATLTDAMQSAIDDGTPYQTSDSLGIDYSIGAPLSIDTLSVAHKFIRESLSTDDALSKYAKGLVSTDLITFENNGLATTNDNLVVFRKNSSSDELSISGAKFSLEDGSNANVTSSNLLTKVFFSLGNPIVLTQSTLEVVSETFTDDVEEILDERYLTGDNVDRLSKFIPIDKG